MAAAEMNGIKTRIKSVTSTKQITKAMELVATSKLRRAKEKAENTHSYQKAITKAIKDIRSFSETKHTIYGDIRPNPKSCFIVIAGDRGLAGGFNNNIFRLADSEAKKRIERGESICYLPIGKKAIEHYSRGDNEIVSHNFLYTAMVTVGKSFDIGHMVTELFKSGKIDRIEIFYSKFISMLAQQPFQQRLLPLKPLSKESDIKNSPKNPPEYEGDPDEMLDIMVPQFVGSEIYIGASESVAAECAARRTAMNSANKNADEMINSLTLRYNRARQGVITQEITEIISGAEMNHE